MKKQTKYCGFDIEIIGEKIRSDEEIAASQKPLKAYRAKASVLDPVTGRPICGQDVRAAGKPCRTNKSVCVEVSALTMEQAMALIEQKFPRLLEKVRPVLEIHTNVSQSLLSLYSQESKQWGLSQRGNSWLQNNLLPLLDQPVCDIRPEELYQIVQKLLEKQECSENQWNTNLGYVKKMLEALIQGGYLKKEDHFLETLDRLRKTGKSNAGKKREVRDHLTDKERAALFAWARAYPEKWLSVFVLMLYLVRDVAEICALNTDDLQWISVEGVRFAVFWVCKRMNRKDKKYAVDREIPSPHLRRLAIFAFLQTQMDARAATLDAPPQSRPLVGDGPHGTVRIPPDKAEKELAALLREQGIQARVHTSQPDSDNDLEQLLRNDAAYCAGEVMHLRDAERELLLGLAFTGTDARHYWDSDCDETMFKLWLAGNRLFPPAVGTLQSDANRRVIPADGFLTLETPEGSARWQVQVQANREVTLQADSRYGHTTTEGQ